VLEMEACWPSGVVLRGMASNHRMLRWLKTVVVSDPEKARLTRQVGTRKTFQKAPGPGFSGWVCAVDASLEKLRWHQKRGVWLFSCDEPGGRPDDWPGGARREGGVSLVCGSGTEREKASVESGRPGLRVSTDGRREGACRRRKPEALSTGRDVRWRTGPY
jgi:hypothetical protein